MTKYSKKTRNDSFGHPQRHIPLPRDVVHILNKDTWVEPKLVEKTPRGDKVRCRLCDEPRTQRALDENGICRSVEMCNRYRRLGARIDGESV